MFHYKDGLFFGRNEDGSVKIRKMRDATGSAALVAEMDIDPGGWASIVAHVSAETDFVAAAKAVLEFHMEGCLRVPAPMAEQHLTGITPPDEVAAQIDRLASFILNEVPGEPARADQGAVDTAIRLLRAYVKVGMPLPPPLNAEPEQPVESASAEAAEVAEPSPPGAELEQPTEAPPEQPTEGEGKPPEGA